MCYFITATLPMNADRARLAPIAARHHRAFTPLHNPHVEAQLPPTVHYYLTTVGRCDCGTALGSARREQARSLMPDTVKQAAGLRRRGWSASKIERWLEQQTNTIARTKRVRRDHAPKHTPDANEWCLFIRAIIESGDTDSVGLLLHWYQGAIDTERIALPNHQFIRVSALDADALRGLSEDVLYQICR